MGVEELEDEERDKIKEEAELHNDIIYFNDVKNSYFSLTDRIIKVLQYITEQRYRFSYVLKCDDDTFLDVRRIAAELQKRENPGLFYWGQMVMGLIQTEGKWQETEWSSCQTYYPHAYGGGYVLSRDLVLLVVENEPYLKRYRSEDISIGLWVSAYNIERKHDARFTTGASARGCKKPYWVKHKVSREGIYVHYASLAHAGSICGPTNSWYNFGGYIYNWTAFPPSKKCCIREKKIP